MATVVRMPSVLAGATEAAIAHWLVAPGDTVAPGTPIAELETEKALVEYAAEEAGVIGRLVLGEGDSAEIGDPIAVLVAAGETDADIDAALGGPGQADPRADIEPGPPPLGQALAGVRAAAPTPGDASAAVKAGPSVPGPAVTASAPAAPGTNGHHVAAHPAAGHGGRVFASPLVRKLAGERGIDLAALAGTGPNGRIVRRDLERYLAVTAPAAPAAATTDGGGAAGTAAAGTGPAGPAMAGIASAGIASAGTGAAGNWAAGTTAADSAATGSAINDSAAASAAPASPPAPLSGGAAGREEQRASVPLDTQEAARTAGGGTAPAGAGLIPHTPMRRAIARRLTESKATVPHFYLVAEPVVDELLALRQRVNEALSAGAVAAGTVSAGTVSAGTVPAGTVPEDAVPAGTGPVRVSVNDFVIAAVAAAFGDVPEANVTWSEDGLVTYRSVDISIAVATEGGLVTPVLRRAEGKKLSAIARESAALARRARDRRLRQHELEGGTFTVSNLGMYGTAEFSAIINPPQSGIIAVGAARPQPVVAGGAVVAATVMRCTLSVDHRAIDGALAARWLAAFTARLENPLGLLA